MSRMRRVRGLLLLCRGRFDMRKAPVVCRGFFVSSEGADAAAEFVWQWWFRIAVEEFLVDDFAEVGEPVA